MITTKFGLEVNSGTNDIQALYQFNNRVIFALYLYSCSFFKTNRVSYDSLTSVSRFLRCAFKV